MEMVLKKKRVVLNERIMEPFNGVRATNNDQKSSLEGELQSPVVVAASSIRVVGLVAATLFVCYSKQM
ncbi:unnamed protein product [Arabis nemorensis]|uniref:Uncharacterized protein n=1 Tax=Arabis nemorensis TaxID=586526 RepID=A0A565B0D4_9BRAS|nr:unnamed protein product [Arabis nemorensis]